MGVVCWHAPFWLEEGRVGPAVAGSGVGRSADEGIPRGGGGRGGRGVWPDRAAAPVVAGPVDGVLRDGDGAALRRLVSGRVGADLRRARVGSTRRRVGQVGEQGGDLSCPGPSGPVSYTHLTLPTNR